MVVTSPTVITPTIRCRLPASGRTPRCWSFTAAATGRESVRRSRQSRVWSHYHHSPPGVSQSCYSEPAATRSTRPDRAAWESDPPARGGRVTHPPSAGSPARPPPPAELPAARDSAFCRLTQPPGPHTIADTRPDNRGCSQKSRDANFRPAGPAGPKI